jgi:hypothetical protein
MTTAREDTVRLADLLRREHHALAEFLVALAAFDREQRWVALGYRSLFDFLVRELGLPKGPAYYRMTAAALIQKFPEIVEPLRDGRLNLASLTQLAKVITPENRADVLPRFFHTSQARGAGGPGCAPAGGVAAAPDPRHLGPSTGARGRGGGQVDPDQSERGSSGRTDLVPTRRP